MGMLEGRLAAKPEQVDNATVYVFNSSSRPGKKHITTLHPLVPGEDMKVTCSCEGFEHHGYCWHQEWVQEHA